MHRSGMQDDEAEPIADAEQDDGVEPAEDAESPEEGVEVSEEEAEQTSLDGSPDGESESESDVLPAPESDNEDKDSNLSKTTLELGEERSPSSEPKDMRAYILESPIPGKSDRLTDFETHALCMDLMKHFRDTNSPILNEGCYKDYIKHCEWSLRKFGERALTWLIKMHHFKFWLMHFKSQPLDEDRGSQIWFSFFFFDLTHFPKIQFSNFSSTLRRRTTMVTPMAPLNPRKGRPRRLSRWVWGMGVLKSKAMG